LDLELADRSTTGGPCRVEEIQTDPRWEGRLEVNVQGLQVEIGVPYDAALQGLHEAMMQFWLG
jgi:hypothetical protein